MARDTSPGLRRIASDSWTAVASRIRNGAADLSAWLGPYLARQPAMGQIVAALYLGCAGGMLLAAWQLPDPTPSTAAGGELHLLLLFAAGSVLAVTTLARTDRSQAQPYGAEPETVSEIPRELISHLSHALRTPLNAVIGFSEAMTREMHGPLGHSRYREYARHIRESGGRLLKSSEDALAVAEAMSALMTDCKRIRPETLCAATLLREAWEAARPEGVTHRLVLAACDPCEIVCEHRAGAQALEQLLREAVYRADGDVIEVTVRRAGARLQVHIQARSGGYVGPDGRNLRVMIAHLLLQTQGATVSCSMDRGVWSAVASLPSARARPPAR